MKTKPLRYAVLLIIIAISLSCTAFAQEISIDAGGAVLIDASGGRVLFEQDAHKKLYPASVTKIMTLLIAMEKLDEGQIGLEDRVVISNNAANMGGSQLWMEPGEVKTVEQLLKAIAVASGNDASVALAEHIAGTHEAFVQMMNQRAKELGMENTNFVNCHGLHDENHYTTAYDVALMSRELVKHKKIFELTTIWMEDIDVGKEGRFKTFTMVNSNKLLRRYEGVDGLKTGSHSQAKYCLSATAVKGSLRLIAVVMGAPTSEIRFAESAKLLNYGFARFNSVPIASKDDVINQLKVSKGKEKEINVKPGTDVNILVIKGQESSLEREVVLPKTIKAPVKEGERVGEMLIKQDGQVIDRIELISDRTVEKAGFFEMLKRLIVDWVVPE
ncbi:MAG: D-alanyl-D-alanine carboxypeptidase [Firmicutes bacterium]|nr:D-alanyl-D-alanine carboxypeptidase [Bacillota bacterium]MDI6706021.1 D-alanyl-D-alanine carboxypeptidase family protein [Bacillota bacterium]